MTVTAKVNAFSADLDCSVGHVVNATVIVDYNHNWHLYANFSDSSCTTGPLHLGAQHSGDNKTKMVGTAKFLECPQANHKFVITFAHSRTSLMPPDVGYVPAPTADISYLELNCTVLFCSPIATLEEALVTLDSSAAIMDIIPQSNSTTENVSGWDMALAFNTSLDLAAQLFLTNDNENSKVAPRFGLFSNVLRAISA